MDGLINRMNLDLDKGLLLLAALAYFLVFAHGLYRLVSRKPPTTNVNFAVILIGAVIQSFGLYMRGMDAGSCPIRNPFEVIQFVSWSMILIYLFTGPVFRLSLFGTSTATMAALLCAGSFLVPSWDHFARQGWLGGNPWIETHASLALFSYGVFALLATISALFILQNYSLKTKRFPGIFRFLPSIVDTDHVIIRLLLFGTGVYTFSVGIGLVYWMNHAENVSSLKLLVTVFLWIAYLFVAILRISEKLGGRTLAWICIGLFITALITLWPIEIDRVQKVPTVTSPLLIEHGRS